MSDPAPRRSSHTITLVAVALLIAGLGLAIRQWRVPSAPPSASRASGAVPDTAMSDSSDAVIGRALSQVPAVIDSAELKARWRDEVQGVDVSVLTPAQQELFVRVANAERCTCGCGFTLAACRAYDLTCPVSLPRVESLLDSVRTGKIRSATGLRERPPSIP